VAVVGECPVEIRPNHSGWTPQGVTPVSKLTTLPRSAHPTMSPIESVTSSGDDGSIKMVSSESDILVSTRLDRRLSTL